MLYYFFIDYTCCCCFFFHYSSSLVLYYLLYYTTSTAASAKEEEELGAVPAVFRHAQWKRIRKYQNRIVEAARVINELIQLAKDMREASKRGEKLKMSEDEFLHSMKPLRSMAPQLKSWAMKHSSN
jgi:hypothetical protein